MLLVTNAADIALLLAVELGTAKMGVLVKTDRIILITDDKKNEVLGVL